MAADDISFHFSKNGDRATNRIASNCERIALALVRANRLDLIKLLASNAPPTRPGTVCNTTGTAGRLLIALRFNPRDRDLDSVLSLSYTLSHRLTHGEGFARTLPAIRVSRPARHGRRRWWVLGGHVVIVRSSLFCSTFVRYWPSMLHVGVRYKCGDGNLF